MKFVIAGIALSAVLAMQAAGQSTQAYTAKIPFGFRIGAASYSAGDYTMARTSAMSPEIWQIRSSSGIRGFMCLMAADTPASDLPPALMFNCYGRSCFLASIRGRAGQLSFALMRSRLERETAERAKALEARAVLLKP